MWNSPSRKRPKRLVVQPADENQELNGKISPQHNVRNDLGTSYDADNAFKSKSEITKSAWGISAELL